MTRTAPNDVIENTVIFRRIKLFKKQDFFRRFGVTNCKDFCFQNFPEKLNYKILKAVKIMMVRY